MQHSVRGNMGLKRSTVSAKSGEIDKKWVLVDAQGLVLGRLASAIAQRLRGKHQPLFTAHVNCGDSVIVVNAEKVQLTGRKRVQKTYFRHSGHPGGLKQQTAAQILDGRYPARVLEEAVKGMMPDGPLAREQLRNLRIYAGPRHPHEAQQPQTWDIAELDQKNTGKFNMVRRSAGDDVRKQISDAEERIRKDFHAAFEQANNRLNNIDSSIGQSNERLDKIDDSINDLRAELMAVLGEIAFNTRKNDDPSP